MRQFLIVIGFGVLLLFFVGCVSQVEKSPIVTLGQGSLGVVQFPEPWIKTDSATGEKTVIAFPNKYKIRKDSSLGVSELLFAVQSPDGSYSDNFYTVSLDGRFTVSPATTDEWNQAEQVENYHHQILSRSDPSPQQNVYFRNKTFTKSGELWGIALMSPTENWLALLSYTSKEKPRKKDIFSFLGGGEPQKGEIFLEVYDTSSGKKILAGRAPFSGFGPSFLSDSAFWSNDSYVILPLDSLSQTAFLGILPYNEGTT